MCKCFWHRLLPRFLKKLLESEILVCGTMAKLKTPLGIIQLWFIYSAASFFKALGNVNVKYLKIPEKHRRPHAARVFETPGEENAVDCFVRPDRMSLWSHA